MRVREDSMTVGPDRRPSFAWIAVFSATFVFLLLSMDRQINLFDEGIVLTGAMRLDAGELVHRDFYSLYGPGSYRILATLFEWFPAWFVAARLFGIAVLAGIVAAASHSLRNCVPRAYLVGFVCVAAFWLQHVGNVLYPLYPCILLSLIAMNCLTSDAALHGRWRLVAAGACTGLIAFFRYDVAVFVLAADIVVLVLFVRLERRADALRATVRAVAIVALAALLVYAPAAIAFLRVSSPAWFFADVIEYGFKYYGPTRGLPFPWGHDLLRHPANGVVYLPVIAIAWSLAECARLGWGRTSDDDDRRTIRVLVAWTTLAALMFLKGLVRVQPLHLMGAIVPSLAICAICAARGFDARKRRFVRVAALATALLSIPTAFAIGETVKLVKKDPTRLIAGWMVGAASSREVAAEASCPSPTRDWGARIDPDMLTIARFVDAYSRPDERILVGLTRHDRIFTNPITLYFLADRLPATHWHEFDPGVQTREDIQARMVEELASGRTRIVVRDSAFAEEPNRSRESSGVRLLDDYLAEHFHEVARVGGTFVWFRNGELPERVSGIDEDRCVLLPNVGG
jgi:hypothetical protein